MLSLLDLAVVLWALLPAYVPNNVAVLAGGGTSIDGGRTWRGRRVLGDGKTWAGLAAGLVSGVGIALVLNRLNVQLLDSLLPVFSIRVALVLALGAMLGDIGASFIKRRLDHNRGAPMPGLDQLDFLVGAFALSLVVTPTWLPMLNLVALGVVVVLTPVLHLGVNRIAFALGLKAEPW